MTLRLLDLFSGIGGFSLGLERTGGFETVAFCEIDPFCRRVLAKHWPKVRQYEDVRELTADRLQTDGISVDVICGGFPCQDISVAGKGGGIEGERSGLWSEYARLVGELRPDFVIVENVAALIGRGLDRVLGDLAALGFDAEWHCIPASAVGAPHRRDRLWIVAHTKRGGLQAGRPERTRNDEEVCGRRENPRHVQALADASGDVADTVGLGQQAAWQGRSASLGEGVRQQPLSYADREPTQRLAIAWRECGDWLSEPDVGRVAHGVPSRVDRLRSLGNAVVPQIPELIGNAILALLQAECEAA